MNFSQKAFPVNASTFFFVDGEPQPLYNDNPFLHFLMGYVLLDFHVLQ